MKVFVELEIELDDKVDTSAVEQWLTETFDEGFGPLIDYDYMLAFSGYPKKKEGE